MPLCGHQFSVSPAVLQITTCMIKMHILICSLLNQYIWNYRSFSYALYELLLRSYPDNSPGIVKSIQTTSSNKKFEYASWSMWIFPTIFILSQFLMWKAGRTHLIFLQSSLQFLEIKGLKENFA